MILKQFIGFCEDIDAVEPGLADRVPLPNVPEADEVSDDAPTDEEVAEIRSFHQKFRYASRPHTEFELIAVVGLRLGAIRAIDLEDVDIEEQTVTLVHRPEETDQLGTPLKNGKDGQRVINLSADLASLIDDYIDATRHDVRDKYDRSPLFTTPEGRVTTTTIRRDFYKMSRPCEYTGECPHDRDIDACEATLAVNASKCPSSFSTHPLRRWSIMRQLDEGVRNDILSDRVDVSVPVLEKHYDRRSDERKARFRRGELEQHLPEYGRDDLDTS